MSPTQKMKTSFAYLLPLILPMVSAQVAHWGPCPEPAVQQSFNLQKYLGKWYEIAKLPAQFEKGSCIEANYSIRADGTIKVYNSEILKGKLRSIEGTAVVQDINEPAKLAVSFSYVTPYTPYWVLSTDYEHSALVYSCTDVLRLFHFDFAWILSRMRSLPPETIQKAKDLFTNSSIDISKMIMTQQQGCDLEL
ncbi:apolipoprotein Da, duplicate 1 [Scleropages formosus]|uniref:Apolipoprotein D n=1 Tax=Scleropages formosus TaxID=113540 RepID=A0A8C9V208_SCLFO|nr:apolipoprotein D-like [Scleropages formosus]XP_018608854.2 apolipoprotein D-like [Scleropages formosus]